MPVPSEYQRATDEFHEFLTKARQAADFTTTHQAYTMVQGVFQAFRRRLELRDAIRFLSILPVGMRALFASDWNPDEPRRPFESREVMTKEAQLLRPLHNFAPETAIHDVAVALRSTVDEAALAQLLETLPQGAKEFWEI